MTPIIGYLSPEGILYPCAFYEHTSKAEELVDQFNLTRVKPFEMNEDILLRNAWICIRTHDVLKAYYDENSKIVFITDAQKEFFAKHKLKLNDRQLSDLYQFEKDFGRFMN